VGTEPGRLKKRLEAALGPPWGSVLHALGLMAYELLVGLHPVAPPAAAAVVMHPLVTHAADRAGNTREAHAGATRCRKEYSQGRLPTATGGRFT